MNSDLGFPTFSYEVVEDTFVAFKRIRNSYCSSKQQFISVKYIYSWERELGEFCQVEIECWQHWTRMLLSVFANYGALCKLTKARSLGPLTKVSLLIRVWTYFRKLVETGAADGQEPRSNWVCAKTRGQLAVRRKSHQSSLPRPPATITRLHYTSADGRSLWKWLLGINFNTKWGQVMNS